MMRVSAVGAHLGRLLGEGGGLGLGHVQQAHVSAGNLEDEQVSEMTEQIGEQTGQILALLRERVQSRSTPPAASPVRIGPR